MRNEGFREGKREREWARRCQGRVAFLRHKVPGIIHDEGSDWDLAVRDIDTVRKITREMLGAPWVLVSRTFVEQRYFHWGQIDFLPCFEWNGICYLNAARFWSGVTVGEDGLPRPRVAHDAFIVWMTGLLWGGNYREKYDSFLQRAIEEDEDEFLVCLEEAFGSPWARDLHDLVKRGKPGEATKAVRELREALRMRAILRQPGLTIEGMLRHWAREAYLHWKPPYPWVALLGPDGSGKTTIIEGLEKSLKRSRLKLLRFHWYPKRAGQEPEDARVETDPHGSEPRGFFLFPLQLLLLAVRWMRGRWGKVWHRRSKERMLISDRHYLDLLVDPKRYRYGGSLKIARWFFRWFPNPDLTIILVGKAEVFHERKAEMPLASLRELVDRYHELAKEERPATLAIDATRKPSEVLEDVFENIRSCVFEDPPSGERDVAVFDHSSRRQ